MTYSPDDHRNIPTVVAKSENNESKSLQTNETGNANDVENVTKEDIDSPEIVKRISELPEDLKVFLGSFKPDVRRVICSDEGLLERSNEELLVLFEMMKKDIARQKGEALIDRYATKTSGKSVGYGDEVPFQQLVEKVGADDSMRLKNLRKKLQGGQENEDNNLEEYFASRLLEIIDKNQKETFTLKEKMTPFLDELSQEDIHFQIGINSLRELADDPGMPREKAERLKMTLRGIEMRKSGNAYEKKNNIQGLEHLNRASQRHLLDQLKGIFSSEFISNLEKVFIGKNDSA